MLSAVVGWCAISAAGVFYLHHTNPQHWFFVFVEEKVFPLLKEHTGVDVMETLKLKEEPPPPILYASSAAFVGKKASKQKKAAKDANKEKAAKKAAKEKAAKALSLERRVDPADGNLYTRQEFADQYGGAIEWDAAGEEEEARRDDTWTLVEKKVEQDWWGEQEPEEQDFGIVLTEETAWQTVDDKATAAAKKKERPAGAPRQYNPAAHVDGPNPDEVDDSAAELEEVAPSRSNPREMDGLTKKQRENKRKAEKKKALKAAVEAARKNGGKSNNLKANRSFASATKTLGNAGS